MQQQPTLRRPKWYENVLLIMLIFSVGMAFYDRLALNYLFAFIAEELKLNNTELGYTASVLALTWAIGGPVLGHLSNKTGKKTMIILCVTVSAVVSLLSGIVAGFVSLLVIRLVLGLFLGPILPVAQATMSLESSEHRRGLNMGFLQSTAAALFGAIIAPVVVVAVANAWGWRTSFYTTIIPGIIIAIVLLVVFKEPKVRQVATITSAEELEKVRIWDVLKHRNVVVGLLMGCANLTWYIATATFTATYLIVEKGMTASDMSIAVMGLGIGGAVWGFGSPWVSDRIGRKPATIIFSFISVLSPLAVVFLPASVAILFVAFCLVHVGQGIIPIYMSIIPAESLPAKYVAMTVGLIIGVGEVFGGVLMPIIEGRLADTWDPAAPFYIAAVGAFIASILAFWLKETAPVKVRKLAAASGEASGA